MNIRDAQIDDLPKIVSIYNDSVPEGWSTADTRPVSVEEKRDWFAKHDPNKRPIWVLEIQGEIVAWVSLEWFYQGRPAYNATAEISTYVAKNHRQKGYGRFLKTKMIEKCPVLGVKNIISMYFDHNPATQKLNDEMGFVEAGHLQNIAEIAGEKRGLKIAILRL